MHILLVAHGRSPITRSWMRMLARQLAYPSSHVSLQPAARGGTSLRFRSVLPGWQAAR